MAELLSERTLVIPSYETLEQSEIEGIAKCLNEGWAELPSRNAGKKTAEFCSAQAKLLRTQ